MTDEELERRTLDAIQREFGLGGFARFISQFGKIIRIDTKTIRSARPLHLRRQTPQPRRRR